MRAGALVQVVDVLRQEEELVGERRQLRDGAMRGVWFGAADHLAILTEGLRVGGRVLFEAARDIVPVPGHVRFAADDPI